MSHVGLLGLGFRAQGEGFREAYGVQGEGSRVSEFLGFRRIRGLGFRRISGFRV